MNPIRRHREKRQITQADLANLLGVSVDTVRRYEYAVSEPRSTELRKMAEIFGCSLEALVAIEPSSPAVASEKEG